MTTIVVNGVKREVQAPTDTPLLYVLRNDLELTGPQFGCGMAQCGACSVLLNGKEVRSCITTLGSRGRQGGDHAGRPSGALGQTKRRSRSRCGQNPAPYSGGVDRGADAAVRVLPERHDDQSDGTAGALASPTVAEIKEAFTTSGTSAHLCRCGSYTAIIQAVQRAATTMAKRSQA